MDIMNALQEKELELSEEVKYVQLELKNVTEEKRQLQVELSKEVMKNMA
jgi:hypothetical protein